MELIRAYIAILALFLFAGSTRLSAATDEVRNIRSSDEKSLQEARTNLVNSTKNLETVENEIQALKRLEKDHLLLVSDIGEQIKQHAADTKSKARDRFLFQAEKMRSDVNQQLAEIQSRFAPLEKEKSSWSERMKKYEVLVSDLEKKLNSQIDSSAASSSAPADSSVNSDKAPAE